MAKIYNSTTIHPSWINFFDKEIQKELKEIESAIGKNFTPKKSQILRFAHTDLTNVKVVWIGLDPYDGEDVATGRAFEVAGLNKWRENKSNASLRNILKLVHKSERGTKKSYKIKSIYNEISKKEFTIKSPDKIFDYWEKQGVLFLNTALTSEINNSGGKKHLELWDEFFGKLLEFIFTNNKDVVVFSFGKKVNKKVRRITNGKNIKVYYSSHPRNNNEKAGFEENSHFLNNPCFKETKKLIRWI